MRQKHGKRSRRNQEGVGSRVQGETFVLKEEGCFSIKTHWGKIETFWGKGERRWECHYQMKFSINYEAHSSPTSSGSRGGCVGLGRGERLGTAAGGICRRPARDEELGYAAASRGLSRSRGPQFHSLWIQAARRGGEKGSQVLPSPVLEQEWKNARRARDLELYVSLKFEVISGGTCRMRKWVIFRG